MHVLLILDIKSNAIRTWLFSKDMSPLSSYLFIYLFFLYYFIFIQHHVFFPVVLDSEQESVLQAYVDPVTKFFEVGHNYFVTDIVQQQFIRLHIN